jgi:hypothetical protein
MFIQIGQQRHAARDGRVEITINRANRCSGHGLVPCARMAGVGLKYPRRREKS